MNKKDKKVVKDIINNFIKISNEDERFPNAINPIDFDYLYC